MTTNTNTGTNTGTNTKTDTNTTQDRAAAVRRRALRTHCLIEYGWGLEAVQTELMHAPLVRIFEANPLARAIWLHDAQHVEPIRIPRRVRSRPHHTLRRGKK